MRLVSNSGIIWAHESSPATIALTPCTTGTRGRPPGAVLLYAPLGRAGALNESASSSSRVQRPLQRTHADWLQLLRSAGLELPMGIGKQVLHVRNDLSWTCQFVFIEASYRWWQHDNIVRPQLLLSAIALQAQS